MSTPSRRRELHRSPALLLVSVLVSGIAFTQHAGGHEGATGLVKERMQSMKSMARAGKTLSRMAKGEMPFDTVEVQRLLAEMDEHAERIPGYFPDTPHSRGGSKTEAAPAIWSRRAEFDELARELSRESRDLSTWVRDHGDADFAARFKAVSQTCRGCHKDFRIRKD